MATKFGVYRPKNKIRVLSVHMALKWLMVHLTAIFRHFTSASETYTKPRIAWVIQSKRDLGFVLVSLFDCLREKERPFPLCRATVVG